MNAAKCPQLDDRLRLVQRRLQLPDRVRWRQRRQCCVLKLPPGLPSQPALLPGPALRPLPESARRPAASVAAALKLPVLQLRLQRVWLRLLLARARAKLSRLPRSVPPTPRPLSDSPAAGPELPQLAPPTGAPGLGPPPAVLATASSLPSQRSAPLHSSAQMYSPQAWRSRHVSAQLDAPTPVRHKD